MRLRLLTSVLLSAAFRAEDEKQVRRWAPILEEALDFAEAIARLEAEDVR